MDRGILLYMGLLVHFWKRFSSMNDINNLAVATSKLLV